MLREGRARARAAGEMCEECSCEGGLLSARWMRRACRPPTAVEPAHAQLSAAYSGCNVLLLCVLLAGAVGEEE